MKTKLYFIINIFVFLFFINWSGKAFADSLLITLDGNAQQVGEEYIQRVRVDCTVGDNATIKCNMVNPTFVNNSDTAEFQDISNLNMYDESTSVTYRFTPNNDMTVDTGLSTRKITKYYQLKLKLDDGFEVGNYTNTLVFNTISSGGASAYSIPIIFCVQPYYKVDVLNTRLINKVVGANALKPNYSQISTDNMHLEIKANTSWVLTLRLQDTTNKLNQCIKLISTSPYVTSYINDYTSLAQHQSLTIASGTKTVSSHKLVPAAIDLSSQLTIPKSIISAGNYDINIIFDLGPN